MRLLIKFIFLLTLIGASLLGSFWWWANQPIHLRNSPLDFRIVSGSSFRSAINQMQEAGVSVHPTLLELTAKINKAETGIKAGSYSIKQGITPLGLIEKLLQGKVSLGQTTLIEGWTLRQWRQKIATNPDLVQTTRGMSEQELALQLGLPTSSLEGWLFPDTYLFDKQSNDLDVLARAVRAMEEKLNTEWANRAPDLPYKTPYEALIMASIVEKETGREADRSTVAAVFVNRLRRGMLLQTDPTVIYGMGESFDGRIFKKDLQTDTPYNTYTRSGLPPTPIAMPGLNSIRAALHPATTDVVYFVARGDGTSEFSRTLDEHNRAVNKYIRGRK